jgi:putative transposase
MRGAVSPGTGHRYPLTMICASCGCRARRFTWRWRRGPVVPALRAKRGPKTAVGDAEIVEAIRAMLAATPFHGEGYRKIRARLAIADWPSAASVFCGCCGCITCSRRGAWGRRMAPAHAGTIITTRPNEMWGTDATGFYTDEDGWCWFFGAIDHCVDELVGWHTAKVGDRWAALEPLRQGVRHEFGGFAKNVARGLRIRCDWEPQYFADACINEVKWLGMTSRPWYVGEPECYGVIVRLMRTLKEQCLLTSRMLRRRYARPTYPET